MTRKVVTDWFITGTPVQIFFKEAVAMSAVSFFAYCVWDWKLVSKAHFATEDLWVTAICSGIGFGLVAAMNGIDSRNSTEAAKESTSNGLSSEK